MTSCQVKEFIYGQVSSSITLEFTCQDDTISKTFWNGETIMWSKGDCISIAYTAQDIWSTQVYPSSPLKANAEKGLFSVPTDLTETSTDIDFFAVYPASSLTAASLPEIIVNIPTAQTPAQNSYDAKADLMIAKATETYTSVPNAPVPLIWERIAAHADITIKSPALAENERILSLQLTTDQDALVTGNYTINIETGSYTATESSSNEISLSIPGASVDTDGNFKAWASVMPCKISSLKIEILTTDAIYTRQIQSCDITLMANTRNMLSIDMSGATKKEKSDASTMIRNEHPRMFITSEDISTLKANATGYGRAIYSSMRSRINTLMSSGITFPDPLAKSGEYNTNHEIGFRACEAALIWLVTNDQTYLNHTKTILKKLTEYYQLRVDNDLNVAWYIYSQICALCAYDWIYNDLTADERTEYGQNLYNVMYDIAWHGAGIRKQRYRENISGHTSGCYGVDALPYYIGLAFYGDGINDAKCAEMFESGYNLHKRMADYRSQMVGEDGGAATTCATYQFGTYPVADFNFIYTYRSATGMDLSEEMSYVRKYLNYINWIRLPANKEYGLGDTSHYLCKLPDEINYHIAEIVNLYGNRYPDLVTLASRMLSQFTTKTDVDHIPFMRMLHTVRTTANSNAAAPSEPKSIYYENMGQLYMRSGIGANDSYAVFVSGGVPTNHKHFDNNHFILYKNGYRALDSGTRPEPGQHLSHYYSRTVAHNCVTIRMPDETMPSYWGSAAEGETVLPVPNDGGQCNQIGSVLKAHIETDDYVYLASDATKCYNSQKAELVMREFVWCVPDIYIVFDRIKSKDASYPKTWLYHTAAEPVINGLEFIETSQGGTSICRTLFPKDALVEKIGGSGKQFWSDGQNWPLPSSSTLTDWPTVGQWRIEVKPGSEATTDYMMHIIQVGDTSLASLPQTETFEDSAHIGVSFEYEGKKFRLSFSKNATENYGCDITIN